MAAPVQPAAPAASLKKIDAGTAGKILGQTIDAQHPRRRSTEGGGLSRYHKDFPGKILCHSH